MGNRLLKKSHKKSEEKSDEWNDTSFVNQERILDIIAENRTFSRIYNDRQMLYLKLAFHVKKDSHDALKLIKRLDRLVYSDYIFTHWSVEWRFLHKFCKITPASKQFSPFELRIISKQKGRSWEIIKELISLPIIIPFDYICCTNYIFCKKDFWKIIAWFRASKLIGFNDWSFDFDFRMDIGDAMNCSNLKTIIFIDCSFHHSERDNKSSLLSIAKSLKLPEDCISEVGHLVNRTISRINLQPKISK
jgi:hypothetical protein